MYSRNPILTFTLVMTSFLSTGCPLVEIEVEAQSVCVSVERIEFEGAAALEEGEGTAAIETTVDATESAQAISEALSVANLTSTFALTKVEARINAGPSAPNNFEFVEALQLVAHAPSTDLAPVVLVDCEDCSATDAELDRGMDPVDMSSYIHSGELVLDIAVVGQPPQEAWSMTVDLCFASTASYEKDL